MNKTCLLCQHCVYDTAVPDYSDYTPGSEFSLYCRLQFFTFDPYETGQKLLAEYLSLAETCKEYMPSEDK